MNWITLLKDQQTDFIQRLQSGCCLHCEIEGRNSELTIISGNRLGILRDFCWAMVDKYKSENSKNCFKNHLKGKLGEEVVKSHLSNFVSGVNYEKYLYGDGEVDLTLASHPNIGIQVKVRQGDINHVKWSISKQEIDKNAVLVCVLIQEEVNEAQNEYHLILAGFLPTSMVNISHNIYAEFRINELLYSGGLRSYLKSLISQTDILQNELAKDDLDQSDVLPDEFDKYNSALKDLMLYIINKIIKHKDFVTQFKDIAQSEATGAKESTHDNYDGLIEGEITNYEISDSTFEIKDCDIYTLEYNIDFKSNGTAYIGYVNSDGDSDINQASCLCEGNVKIILPDYFKNEFLIGDTIEEIIEYVIPMIKFQIEIYNICCD